MNKVLLVAFPVVTVACTSTCPEEKGSMCLYAGVPEIAQYGGENMPAVESPLYLPVDLTFRGNGEAYLLDFNNHRIRRVDEEGVVRTIAGTGFLGDGPEGPMVTAAFNHPTNLAFAPGDDDTLHMAAWHNSRIVSFDLSTETMAFECGTGARSFGGDEGPANAAFLDLPSSIAYDADGNLYISDQANQVIRKVTIDGVIHTIAGKVKEPGYSGDGGPALQAQFHASVGQAADPSSRIAILDRTLYMVDTDNHVVRTLDLDLLTVDTLAGGGPDAPGFEDGPGDQARFAAPRDLAVDDDGTIFVADTDNSCIREISPEGEVSTIAGICGEEGYGEDHTDDATTELMNRPYGVTIGPDGNLYVADTHNHVFRKIYR